MFETKKTSVQHVLQIIWEIQRNLWIRLPKVKCWDSEKKKMQVVLWKELKYARACHLSTAQAGCFLAETANSDII